MVTRTHLTPWRTFDIMKNKLWTCKTDMPASFACTTSCYHLYQAKLLHMLLILSSGDVAVHHPSNPTWQHWPYPLPGSLYQFSYTSLEICHPLYELCCPSLEQWQPPWGREQCCLWLEWCSMSLDWCCPALDWCRPSWQQCLLLLGEQSPLRLEWYLCHPSDPVRWRQICGRRSPPPGLKVGKRRRHTWPEGPAKVLSNDFAQLPKWQCLIDLYFGRCEGRLALDWMCIRKFLSDFHENWSEGCSLMVRDCLTLLVDDSAVLSHEVCRRRGSHIHDWRSARQPISPSIGDWKLTCVYFSNVVSIST